MDLIGAVRHSISDGLPHDDLWQARYLVPVQAGNDNVTPEFVNNEPRRVSYLMVKRAGELHAAVVVAALVGIAAYLDDGLVLS